MQYPLHAGFVAPARDHPQLWRLILGILSIGIVWLIATFAVFGLAYMLSDRSESFDFYIAQLMTGGTPTGTLVLLATFIGLFIAAILAARLLHKRAAGTLFGSRSRLWTDFGIAFAVAIPILVLSGLLYPTPEPRPNLEIGLWLTFLPMAAFLVFLQTGAEELAFRGYLQQQFAARYASPVIWLGVPSILFALLHYSPEVYPGNEWFVVLAVGVFALCAADLTARTGTIGAAWGFHFANNLGAITFVSIEGPLGGVALYLLPAELVTPEVLRPGLWQDMTVTVIIWLALRLILSPRRIAAH